MENLRTNTPSFPVSNSNVFNSKNNTEQMFEYAIEQANIGNETKAMEIAREALITAKQNNLYLAIYIHSFMAALCMERKDFGSARIHIYNATNKLNTNHFSYNTDKIYLDALLALIEKKDGVAKQLHFDALAA
ncbi:MAG: hypothetical protein ACPGR5_05775 [Chitinophagales bacterium]